MGRHVPKRVDTDSEPDTDTDTDSDDCETFIHGNNPPVGMVF